MDRLLPEKGKYFFYLCCVFWICDDGHFLTDSWLGSID